MWLAALVSAMHILGISLSFGGITLRSYALKRGRIPLALHTDTAWGIGAVLMIGTGLARAFAGLEKGTDFYLATSGFHLKMTLVGLVCLLEVWPMITLIRWRMTPDLRNEQTARTLARISHVQLVLMVVIVFVAAAMARGV